MRSLRAVPSSCFTVAFNLLLLLWVAVTLVIPR